MENIKIKNLIFLKQEKESLEYQEIMKVVKKQKIKVKTLKAGDSINLSKTIKLAVIYPNKSIFEDQNNNSLVVKLIAKNFNMLFTGDIEEKAENKLLEQKIELQATILKVAHHGSKTSSGQEFLKRVSPQIAFIGVGKKNTFGHPSWAVLERLENVRM